MFHMQDTRPQENNMPIVTQEQARDGTCHDPIFTSEPVSLNPEKIST